jgi:hypothetical protein
LNKTTFALALAIACLATNALAGDLVVTHDEFEDTTTIADDGISVAIYASFNPVRLYPQPQAVFKNGKLQEFRFRVLHRQMGAKPRYDECSDLKLLVDDKPFPLEFAYHHEPARMDTDEIWLAPMTADQAAALGRAKSVRFRVCHDELKPFDEDDLESLAQWKTAVDSAVASGTLPSVDED